jgi:hypothetical protein
VLQGEPGIKWSRQPTHSLLGELPHSLTGGRAVRGNDGADGRWGALERDALKRGIGSRALFDQIT